MRIAIANSFRRRAGGVESYLGHLIPALAARGHAIALWVETNGPADRDEIPLPGNAALWSAEDMGQKPALDALRRWRPDVIFLQGLASAEAESNLQKIAGCVFYAHTYNGVCVGGDKAFHFPAVRPCNRVFGPACLAHYFPRRCGGLNPATMLKQYSLHAKKLETLRRCQAIAVNSERMAEEYRRHGLGARTRKVPLPVPAPEGAEAFVSQTAPKGPWNILFLGRMETTKGGHYLLKALPMVLSALRHPIRATFAGDGRMRPAWEKEARRLQGKFSGLEIHFPGWADDAQRRELFQSAHLLAVPSLWPEPFGLAGVEAGHFGVPAAAYALGGIPDWLTEGVNGALAPGGLPTVYGLADAIRRCLADPKHYACLRQGAANAARQFTMEKHLSILLPLLESAAH